MSLRPAWAIQASWGCVVETLSQNKQKRVSDKSHLNCTGLPGEGQTGWGPQLMSSHAWSWGNLLCILNVAFLVRRLWHTFLQVLGWP